MKIIVDAMGGDNAPEAPVLGAVEAAKTYGIEIVLVGRGEDILAVLKKHGIDNLPEGMEIVKVSTPSKYADFLLGETEDGCRTITVSKKNVAPAASVSSAFTIQPSENNVKNIVLWVACLAVGGAVLVAKLKENK